jgi:hypothetical protein
MSEKYFDKFQQVEYANNIAVNITQRIKFTDSVLKCDECIGIKTAAQCFLNLKE